MARVTVHSYRLTVFTVEDDQVRLVSRLRGQRGNAVLGEHHPEPLPAQRDLDQPADRRTVVDHQDAGWAHCGPPSLLNEDALGTPATAPAIYGEVIGPASAPSNADGGR